MVLNATSIIPSSAVSDLFNSILSLPGVPDVINIIKAVGILIALYIIFLIIRFLNKLNNQALLGLEVIVALALVTKLINFY